MKNRLTRQRYLVSTIRQGENLFEIAVFEATFLHPRSLSKPTLALKTDSRDEAWDLHHRLAARLTVECPARLFQEYQSDVPPAASRHNSPHLPCFP